MKYQLVSKETSKIITLEQVGLAPNGKLYADGVDVTDLYDIRRFSGMHDFNGVEIYEGDILKLNKYDCVWVQFRHGKFITMNVFKGKYIARSDYDSNDLDRVLFGIAIGNVYENPEMLPGFCAVASVKQN